MLVSEPGGTGVKQDGTAGGGGVSLKVVSGALTPASVRLPPSEVTYQSQLPPRMLSATIVFRRMTEPFGFGGTSGAKSDSTTPMPPPTGAELRVIVRLTRCSSPSASWKRPPPRTAAKFPVMVLFSSSASPSALLQKPPPSPPSSCCWASSKPGKRAVFARIVDWRMIRSASGAFAKPPPFVAVFFSMCVSMTRNGSLDEL